MPELNGLETTTRIRKNLPSHYQNQPFIVAFTANALDKDRELCIASGMNGFLSKPFKLNDLKNVVLDAIAYGKSNDTRLAMRSAHQ